MAKNSFNRRSKLSKKRTNLSKRRNKVTRRRNKLSKRRNKVTRRRNKLSKSRNKVTRRRNNLSKRRNKVTKKMTGGGVMINTLRVGDIIQSTYGYHVGEIVHVQDTLSSIKIELTDAARAEAKRAFDRHGAQGVLELSEEIFERDGKWVWLDDDAEHDVINMIGSRQPGRRGADWEIEVTVLRSADAHLQISPGAISSSSSIDLSQIPEATRPHEKNEGSPFIQLLGSIRYQREGEQVAGQTLTTTRDIFEKLDSGDRRDPTTVRDDGKIELIEFQKAMAKYFGSDATREGTPTNATVVAIFNSIDGAGVTDGHISYEEFCHWLTNNFTENCELLPESEMEFLKDYGRCIYLERMWFIYYPGQGVPNWGNDAEIDPGAISTDERILRERGQDYYIDVVRDAVEDEHLSKIDQDQGREHRIIRYPYRESRAEGDVTPLPAGSLTAQVGLRLEKNVDYQNPVFIDERGEYAEFVYDPVIKL